MTAPPALILASASPRRSALLREAGYTFAVVVPDAVELEPGARPPEALCLANARRKARCVAARHPEALVLGCDTIVCLGDLVLGKPDNLDEARRYLRLLQGRTHRVLTGLALCRVCDGLERAVVETTAVTFHPLDEAAIRDYLAAIDPLDKAGAYAAQGDGGRIIAAIDGSRSNVIGLPLERLIAELAELRPPGCDKARVDWSPNR